MKEATRLVATALSEDWIEKGHTPKTVPNIIKQLEADYDFQKRLGKSMRNGKGNAITKAQKKLAYNARMGMMHDVAGKGSKAPAVSKSKSPGGEKRKKEQAPSSASKEKLKARARPSYNKRHAFTV